MALVKVICNGFDAKAEAQEFASIMHSEWDDSIYGFLTDESVKNWNHKQWKLVMEELPFYDWSDIHILDLITFEEAEETVDFEKKLRFYSSDDLLAYIKELLKDYNFFDYTKKKLGSLLVRDNSIFSLSFDSRGHAVKDEVLAILEQNGIANVQEGEFDFLVGRKSDLKRRKKMIAYQQSNQPWYPKDRNKSDSF